MYAMHLLIDPKGPNMKRRTVLISGAGIAGPALAFWLRAYGFEVTVVESAPAPRVGGQAVDIRGAAREVLGRMGVLDAVRELHTGVCGIAYLGRSGEVVARLDNQAFGHSGGVVAELEILRGDLVGVLMDAAGRNVEYIHGDTIVALDESEDSVLVTFQQASPRSFDIVVGADGVRSNVRSLVFGDHDRFVRDLGYYSAYFTAWTDRDLDGWLHAYSLPGRRLAMVYPVGQSGETRTMLSFAHDDAHVGRDDRRSLLCDMFADSGWIVPTLLDQLATTDELFFARVGDVRVDRWSSGRVVLIGDAISAGSLGMGTSMAIVQAYVLAGELSLGDHRRAFGEYRRKLAGFVAENQKRPAGSTAGFLPRTRAGIALRNATVKALPRIPGSGRLLGDTQRASVLELDRYGELKPLA